MATAIITGPSAPRLVGPLLRLTDEQLEDAKRRLCQACGLPATRLGETGPPVEREEPDEPPVCGCQVGLQQRNLLGCYGLGVIDLPQIVTAQRELSQQRRVRRGSTGGSLESTSSEGPEI